MIGYCGTYLNEPARKYRESVTFYQAMLAKLAEEASVPVSILLNESDDEQMVIDAARAGFDFVMYAPVFGDEMPTLQKMTEIQKRIVEAAHACGAAVEGEVGELPLFNTESGEMHDGELTDPDVLRTFVQETGVDTVAVSVGNCHLKEDGKVSIDFDAVARLREAAGIPLVLHGGTSISKEDLTRAASAGIGKVNFGTAMKRIALDVMQAYFKEHDVAHMDPNDVLGRGGERDLICRIQDAVIAYVEETIAAMNGKDKAF